ncbi:isoprenylcysteine carboxyl methyltransferase family protein [Salinibacillus aidingensis]
MMYVLLWLVIVLQRVIELIYAKRNESRMKEQGAKVIQEDLYVWIVRTHIAFLLAILLEAYISHHFSATIQQVWLVLFIFLQAIRMWCIRSLGQYWNTKIIVLPGIQLVKRGPYKWVRHPNYLVVGLEFMIIPLLFKAYISACIFPVLHLALMSIRIPMEERTLQALTKEND